jgi:CubicO group peptidase (beta-lactamase class C family)
MPEYPKLKWLGPALYSAPPDSSKPKKEDMTHRHPFANPLPAAQCHAHATAAPNEKHGHGLLTACMVAALGLGSAAPAALAQAPAAPMPTAEQTDPVKLGWMVGSPPPPDKVIRWADGSFYAFPQFRWTFSHSRELIATSNVSRGLGAVSPLPRAERTDLDAVTFTPLGQTQPMTWGQSISANFTDGIVVLHRGRIVYERYAGALNASGQHSAQSVTKSFFGTIGATLVAEGRLDANAKVGQYIPELKDSGFGDATVRQVLDMTTGLQYSENYADPKAEIWSHVRAGNVLPRPPGYEGPKTFYEFLKTVKKSGEHGEAFAYKTVNSDVLGWLIRRVTNKSVGENLVERIWSQLGMEQDAYIAIDTEGTEFAGGGLNTGLRDLARFGEMMRNDGQFNGKQVIPKAVVDDIRHGGDKANFAKAGYATLPGGSYRNMWWVLHNANGAFAARGIHGQTIYVDPKAEMVIARYASFPKAANAFNDPTTLPAFQALADKLVADPR